MTGTHPIDTEPAYEIRLADELRQDDVATRIVTACQEPQQETALLTQFDSSSAKALEKLVSKGALEDFYEAGGHYYQATPIGLAAVSLLKASAPPTSAINGVQVTEIRPNPRLCRRELRFVVNHAHAKTPARDQVRENLAKLMDAPKGTIVVDSMNSVFGKGITKGCARVYDNLESLTQNEPHYLLKRNKLEQLKWRPTMKPRSVERPPVRPGREFR